MLYGGIKPQLGRNRNKKSMKTLMAVFKNESRAKRLNGRIRLLINIKHAALIIGRIIPDFIFSSWICFFEYGYIHFVEVCVLLFLDPLRAYES